MKEPSPKIDFRPIPKLPDKTIIWIIKTNFSCISRLLKLWTEYNGTKTKQKHKTIISKSQ